MLAPHTDLIVGGRRIACCWHVQVRRILLSFFTIFSIQFLSRCSTIVFAVAAVAVVVAVRRTQQKTNYKSWDKFNASAIVHSKLRELAFAWVRCDDKF